MFRQISTCIHFFKRFILLKDTNPYKYEAAVFETRWRSCRAPRYPISNDFDVFLLLPVALKRTQQLFDPYFPSLTCMNFTLQSLHRIFGISSTSSQATRLRIKEI